MAARSQQIATLLLALAALALAACGGSGGGSSSGGSGGGGGDGGGDGCTGSLAWCAPVGAAVQGATLYDGWEDLRLVPSPVNVNGGWTDSVAVTPDGLHLHFGYTKYDVTDFFIGLNEDPPVLVFNPTGPTRTGMIGDRFQIFRADLGSSGWTVNYHQVNSDDANVMQASASVNEAQDLMVLSRFDGASYDASLWYSQFDGSTWSDPVQLPTDDTGPNVMINSGCTGGGDDNGFVIGSLSSSVTLYWESKRAAADGSTCISEDIHHLYQSTFSAGAWSPIVPIPGLNDFTEGIESNDTQLSLSPDGLTAYWTSLRTHNSEFIYALMTADWSGGDASFINVRPVISPNYVPTAGQLHIQGEINVAEVPEGWIAYLMCGIANTDSASDIELSVCRMRKPAPAKINTATGWSDSPSISRDGKRLYFMYSRYDFAPWILSGDVNDIALTGPDRPGLHKSTANPFDESDIYVSTKRSDGTWGTPISLGFNGPYGDSSGMEFDDGNGFVWLQGDGATNNIVISTRNPDGTWTTPTVLGNGINVTEGGTIEDNPHISSDGTRLYFVSDRSGGQGGRDLYFSEFDGSWSAPVNLGSVINSADNEDQPWISEVTTKAYWNRGGNVMSCQTDETGCITTPVIVDLPGCRAADGKFAAEVSLPDNGKTIYFACGDMTTARVTIMYATKKPGGGWNTAKPVD